MQRVLGIAIGGGGGSFRVRLQRVSQGLMVATSQCEHVMGRRDEPASFVKRISCLNDMVLVA